MLTATTMHTTRNRKDVSGKVGAIMWAVIPQAPAGRQIARSAGLRTLMARPGPTAAGVAEGDFLLVTIGAGSRVLGPVYIGDHVQIGANSVVVKDIPAGAVATGIPATIRFPKKRPFRHWTTPRPRCR